MVHFNPQLPTRLVTDASRIGIGYVLQQQHEGDTWKTVQCGSKMLTDCESRYAVVELELLAIAWAVRRCDVFLRGVSGVVVITDHKPLLSIINHKHVDDIPNPRLQRLKMKLSLYDLTAEWMQGKENHAADALSRFPSQEPVPGEISLAESHVEVGRDNQLVDVRAVKLDVGCLHFDRIREATLSDRTLKSLMELVIHGWPATKEELPSGLWDYYKCAGNLSVVDGVLVIGSRIVLPRTMRFPALKALHQGHQGKERLINMAAERFFWPSLNRDCETIVNLCDTCNLRRPSQVKEPLLSRNVGFKPFRHVAADFMKTEGMHFLVVVDMFSGWLDVQPLVDMSPTSVKLVLEQMFGNFGPPVELHTDCGKQFVSTELKKCLSLWGVTLVTSSPHYPQSNGRVEVAVKAAKKLVHASMSNGLLSYHKLAMALIQHRNTPSCVDKMCPSLKVFGWRMRDGLPSLDMCDDGNVTDMLRLWQEARKRRAKQLEWTKASYNRRAVELPGLQVGDRVAIQGTDGLWAEEGTVEAIINERDYAVTTDQGGLVRRNRRLLRPVTTEGGEAVKDGRRKDGLRPP